MAFRILSNWASASFSAECVCLPQLQVFAFDEKTSVFFVEARYLVRYPDTVAFVHCVIKDCRDVALNRLETHPVENLFGRLAFCENHSWARFRSVLRRKALLMIYWLHIV
jgi:hypothetical protein